MGHYIEVSLKLDLRDDSCGLGVELAVFSKGEYEALGHYKLDNLVVWGVPLIFLVSMHLVPSDDRVGLLQRGVDQTCTRCLKVSDLLGDKFAHKHQVQFCRVKYIEGVLPHDRGDQKVFTGFVTADGD